MFLSLKIQRSTAMARETRTIALGRNTYGLCDRAWKGGIYFWTKDNAGRWPRAGIAGDKELIERNKEIPSLPTRDQRTCEA